MAPRARAARRGIALAACILGWGPRAPASPGSAFCAGRRRGLGARPGPRSGCPVGAGGAGTAVDCVDIARLAARCVQLGDAAGAKMREVQARPSIDVVDKGGEYDAQGKYVADVQTAADREVEELCLAELGAEFPGVRLVAEEAAGGAAGVAAAPAAGVPPLTSPAALAALGAAWPEELRRVEARRVVVYIDPLDGTGEFVRGNLAPVTNLLGIAVDGVPVAGIINQPWAPGLPEGRTIWGGPGVGVHGASVRAEPPPGSICTNRVVRSTRCAGALGALGVTPERDAQRVSATGFNILCVVEGSCSLFVLTRHGTKKWDICGGEALLRSVGGVLTDAVGRPYHYGSNPATHQNFCGVLACRDPAAHAEAASTISESVAPWPFDVEDASLAS